VYGGAQAAPEALVQLHLRGPRGSQRGRSACGAGRLVRCGGVAQSSKGRGGSCQAVGCPQWGCAQPREGHPPPPTTTRRRGRWRRLLQPPVTSQPPKELLANTLPRGGVTLRCVRAVCSARITIEWANMDAEAETQVLCRFVTRMPEAYRVTSTAIAVPATLTRYGLSEVVNHLLNLGAPARSPMRRPMRCVLSYTNVVIFHRRRRHARSRGAGGGGLGSRHPAAAQPDGCRSGSTGGVRGAVVVARAHGRRCGLVGRRPRPPPPTDGLLRRGGSAAVQRRRGLLTSSWMDSWCEAPSRSSS